MICAVVNSLNVKSSIRLRRRHNELIEKLSAAQAENAKLSSEIGELKQLCEVPEIERVAYSAEDANAALENVEEYLNYSKSSFRARAMTRSFIPATMVLP